MADSDGETMALKGGTPRLLWLFALQLQVYLNFRGLGISNLGLRLLC